MPTTLLLLFTALGPCLACMRVLNKVSRHTVIEGNTKINQEISNLKMRTIVPEHSGQVLMLDNQ